MTDRPEGLYVARGVDAEAEKEFAERTVLPHWRAVGELGDEIVYVNEDGKLCWEGGSDYVYIDQEGREALVSGTAEVVYVDGGAATPSLDQQKQVEEANAGGGGDVIHPAPPPAEDDDDLI